MRIVIKTTNTTLTPALRQYAEEKFSRLEKISNQLTIVRIELEYLHDYREKEKFRAEATIDAPHHVFRAESQEFDLYAAIDTLIPKLVSQIEKFKEKKLTKIKKAVREVQDEALS